MRDLDCTVNCTGSPDEACALLTTAAAYNLVITDAFRSPGAAGDPQAVYGGLEMVRRATTAPIMIVSAWPAADFADYQARGYAAVLAKPFRAPQHLAGDGRTRGRVLQAAQPTSERQHLGGASRPASGDLQGHQ